MAYCNGRKEGVFVLQQIRLEKVFTVPNILTLIRISLLPAVALCFKLGDMTGSLVIYLVSMLTDILDGAIARKTHQITALGKLLDPVADKLSLLTMLILFVQSEQMSVWILILVCFKELILIVGGYLALRTGIVVYALPVGKAATAVFVAAITARFVGMRFISDAFLYVYLILSLAALFWYARSAAKMFLSIRVNSAE